MQYLHTKIELNFKVKEGQKIKFDEFDIFHQIFYQQCAMDPRSR